MKNYSELEIVIQRDSRDGFQASARQRLDDGDLITPFVALELAPDDPRLLAADAHITGALLSDALFSPLALRDKFIAASALAQARNMPLRVRLRIDPAAAILHSLAWETMADPQERGHALLRNERCVFSRYLFTRAFRLPMLRPRQDIQALLAVAHPANLGAQFATIDVQQELAAARTALASIPSLCLGELAAATLERIMHALEQGVDVFYLVCHGAVGPNGPALWLQDENGRAALTNGEQFAARISALPRPPSLVVLCSCQSAGVGTPARDALTALGPMLAREGVAAVLAMQGNLTMATSAAFMPTFFSELADHGEVDQATAAARRKVMHRPDWWMPVVFTRLDSARIWSPPGFGPGGDGGDGSDPWASIIGNLRAASCTPILGPGMGEQLYGSHAELAKSWGETYRYPMSAPDDADLPRVAQYLAITREGVFPRREFYKSVYRRILDKFREDVPASLRGLDDAAIMEQLGALVSVVGSAQRQRDPADPHAVLAGFRLPLYITTDPGDLLVDALRERGIEPRVRLLRWNPAAARCDDDYLARSGKGAGGKPTRERPIVIKLFGDLSAPASLVITEDQFFDYLTWVPTVKNIVPTSVISRVCDSALLFVGFQADSWEFRVMFRTLLQVEGVDLRRDHQHFAAQIDPSSILDAGSARRYIEKYLQHKAKLRLYWGDVASFIAELYRRMQGGPP
ncbi:CHAT domain-containing protein [Massilia sp. DWR3-1-1]|uniref:CHAT domain-containing protein n=1 Tax=Massilia sp. DWR3-1-1 TaxID=2804559 RepID=UPI003CF32D93